MLVILGLRRVSGLSWFLFTTHLGAAPILLWAEWCHLHVHLELWLWSQERIFCFFPFSCHTDGLRDCFSSWSCPRGSYVMSLCPVNLSYMNVSHILRSLIPCHLSEKLKLGLPVPKLLGFSINKIKMISYDSWWLICGLLRYTVLTWLDPSSRMPGGYLLPLEVLNMTQG